MRRPRSNTQSLAERTRWLFTREGLPVLISIVVGLVVGYFMSGAVGLVIATIAGFAVLFLFKRPPFHIKPWQALVTDLTPVIGKLFFSLAFVLPIADYLTLPSGHTPNTLPKYLSIVVAIPKNLFSRPTSDVFPGFVFLVIISIVLMYWGSMNLEKRGHLLMSFGGLVLYTVSPLISAALLGRSGIHLIMSFFGVGYYFAWIGLLLLLLAKILPRFLKANPVPANNASGMLNLLPPVVAFGLLAHFSSGGGTGHLQLFQLFDFESTHHFVAGVFSAGVAGVGAGVIVDQADDAAREAISDFDGEIGPPPEEPPDVPEEPEIPDAGGEIGPPPEEPPDVPEEPPLPQGPVPSTDPEDPPGTTVEYNKDGSVTKRQPDGTWGTRYTDGTTYVEGPGGESYTEYPDGTTKEYSPETGLEVKHPNGDMEITLPDGRTGGITSNPDGGIDINSPYGGKLHCPKDGYPEGSLTRYDGTQMTFNKDGSGSVTSPYGGTLDLDKNGNVSGSWTTEQGDHFTFKPDGSFEGKTADGAEISVDADGLKAKFKDGSYFNTDAEGNLTSAHIKTEGPEGGELTVDSNGMQAKFNDGSNINVDGAGNLTSAHIKGEGRTYDINTDDKGTMHIKDDKGYTADINQDGSGKVKDPDGNVATADSNGNVELTFKDDVKWGLKNDGSGFVTDKKGNRIDLNKDGSITAKDSTGKTVTYTADQVNQMKAQSGSGTNPATGGS